MFGQEVLNPIGAELSPTVTGEDDIVFRSTPFLEPSFEDGDCLFGERCTALFTALTDTTDMSSCAQDRIATTQMNEFRKSEARLDGQQEKGMISPARPGGIIRSGQEGLNFGIGEKID
jgi:hypothetical protein